MSLRLTSLLLLCCCGAASAHHGQDFFLVEDADLPAPGHGNIHSSLGWASTGDFEMEPGFSAGLLPRTAFSLNAGINGDGEAWQYESVTPRLHFLLTPPDAGGLRLSLSLSRTWYEGSAGGASYTETTLTPVNEPAKTETITTTVPDTEEPPCDPSVDVDCIPAASPRIVPRHTGHTGAAASTTRVVRSTAASTTYRRTVRERHLPPPADFTTLRLVLQQDFGAARAVLNASAIIPDRGPVEWAYAAGVRYQFTGAWAAGVEAAGDFTSHSTHEIVAGAYWTASHHLTLRLGAGAGLNDRTPDFSIRSGLLWRF